MANKQIAGKIRKIFCEYSFTSEAACSNKVTYSIADLPSINNVNSDLLSEISVSDKIKTGIKNDNIFL